MKVRPGIARSVCASLAMTLVLVAAPAAQAAGGFYRQHNLASDGFVAADHPDGNLVNAWGLAFNPFGFAWVADNETGLATLYDGAGNPQPLVVHIPTPTDASGGSNPTGIVYNGSGGFVVGNGTASGPSRFIFATEDGVIAGWAPNVDPTHAIRAGGDFAHGAVYKAVAISTGGSGQLLYAADFFNAKVDVFDGAFQRVTLAPGAFADPGIPHGFAPFGIQAIDGDIYVSYAKQGPGKVDEEDGPGLGFVDAYDPNGKLLRRVATRGLLDAPWGMTVAPVGFGQFGGRLLIGNFGDGHIHAYDLATGFPVGTLRGANGQPIRIDGLWGIAFGSGFNGQPVDTLFFAAGPEDESHGLYGRLDFVPARFGFGHDGD